MTPADTEDKAGMYRSGWFRIPGSERRPLRLGYEAQLDGRGAIGRLSRDLPPMAAFPPIMDVECAAPAQLTRLYGAYVREWEAVDLPSFRLRSDRSAALCETKSDQS